MLNRFLMVFCATLVLSACYGNKKPKKPENLISKQDMVNILMDIKIMLSASGKNREILDEHGVRQDNYIYNKYGIDSLQFALSNEYYSYYMVQYESIYAKVNDSLSRLKELYLKLKEREEEEQRVLDSLAKIVLDTVANPKELSPKESIKDRIEEVEGLLIEPVSENGIQPQ